MSDHMLDGFFDDLLCFLDSRDDLAGYEIEQTQATKAKVAELLAADEEYDAASDEFLCFLGHTDANNRYMAARKRRAAAILAMRGDT